MYINMTPDKTNKTLHASQDDTTRQFKFKLVNDSQVLDTSDSIPPVIYDVEPNGIEQLLPINSSTPTTTPIIADIQYPDELRENQEFFERITPTTIKGQAKIKKIKGNTLVFNQLCDDNFRKSLVDFTLNNHELTFDFTSTTNTNWWQYQIYSTLEYTAIANHKYLVRLETKSDYPIGNVVFNGDRSILQIETLSDGYVKRGAIFTSLTTATTRFYFRPVGNTITANFHYENIFARNIQLFDLTLIFGLGNEPTSVSDFETWLSNNIGLLPYYDYNAGSLLSFNGTGIKTRPNIINGVEQGTYDGSGNPASDSTRLRNVGGLIPIEVGKSYTLTFNKNNNLRFAIRLFSDAPSLIYDSGWKTDDFTINTSSYPNAKYIAVVGSFISDGTITPNDVAYMFVYEVGVDTTYPLPVSTYFPSGMKSAGTAYDELTPTKATTRIGAVDLGSLIWTYDSANSRFKSNAISDILSPSSASVPANAVCGKYPVLNYTNSIATDKTMTVIFQGSAAVGQLWVHDSSFTSASDFASAMSGVYFYYELATPTEEDIESCSLVSEDIEKPLEYDNGFLVCDSDGLTSKAGFIPCKVKKVKGDETLYSQLINLHVERRP